jgi:hypothetical protein
MFVVNCRSRFDVCTVGRLGLYMTFNMLIINLIINLINFLMMELRLGHKKGATVWVAPFFVFVLSYFTSISSTSNVSSALAGIVGG